MQVSTTEIKTSGHVRDDEKGIYTRSFSDFFGVFLLRGKESERILIPKVMIDASLKEGDIVGIQKNTEKYDITLSLYSKSLQMRQWLELMIYLKS